MLRSSIQHCSIRSSFSSVLIRRGFPCECRRHNADALSRNYHVNVCSLTNDGLRRYLSTTSSDETNNNSNKAETETLKYRYNPTTIPSITKNENETEQESNVSKTSLDNKKMSTRDIMERLYTVAQPEMKLILASAATLGITSTMTLFLPYACGQVLDMAILEAELAAAGQSSNNFSSFQVAFGLFGLTSLTGIGIYARSLMLNIAGNRIVERMRKQLFASILTQEMAFFETDKKSTGDILSRLSNDTYLVKSAVTTEAVAGLRGVVMSVGSTSLLFHTSPTLAMVSLLSLPPVFVGARVMGRTLRSKQTQVQEMHAKAISLSEEVINGISTVQQFVMEQKEYDKYSDAIRKAHAKEIQVGRTKAALDGAVHVAANGAILATLGYGGSMVLAGELSAGDLTGFLMYSLLMAGNISSLSSTYAEMMKSFAAAGRAFEIIDRQPTIPSSFQPHMNDNDDSTKLALSSTSKPMSITFENVRFSYPTRSDVPILGPSFDLKVRAGETVAIVGKSGSGKSTIASILTRLYDIDNASILNGECHGRVLINDTDILKQDTDPSWVRRKVGIVAQEPLLFAGTIADNIRYGKVDASDEDIMDAARAARVLEFTDNLADGLGTQVGSRGLQLSGGQKQRVAIARLILNSH